ncbi:hypothetical protein TcasGA2_TC006695 [Tribolium castaneum]|uniref:Uncharacterized protein n=1 Tax=Tribolium castaneum TaxID=7070 RepID=D6WYI4_TRICA|nr:hypothetical protein TcasGA2_TC006695 [Tribolium castaneum]
MRPEPHLDTEICRRGAVVAPQALLKALSALQGCYSPDVIKSTIGEAMPPISAKSFSELAAFCVGKERKKKNASDWLCCV